MPTKDEFEALGDAVNTSWTSDYKNSGIAGLICTDKEDSSKILFFPAAAGLGDGYIGYVGSYGYYWSSSLKNNYVDYAHRLLFRQSFIDWTDFTERHHGHSIRPVLASGDSERPYVEIAGIKWSTMNIGASTETDAGLYFQWGDIQGYTASQCGSGEG